MTTRSWVCQLSEACMVDCFVTSTAPMSVVPARSPNATRVLAGGEGQWAERPGSRRGERAHVSGAWARPAAQSGARALNWPWAGAQAQVGAGNWPWVAAQAAAGASPAMEGQTAALRANTACENVALGRCYWKMSSPVRY